MLPQSTLCLAAVSLAVGQLVRALPSFVASSGDHQNRQDDQSVLSASAPELGFEGYQVWRMPINRKDVENVGKLLNLDIWAHHPSSVDVLVPPHLMSHPLLASYIPNSSHPAFIPDVQKLIAGSSSSAFSSSSFKPYPRPSNGSIPITHPFHDRFHTYDEIHSFLLDLQTAWPEWVDVFSIGQSAEGRDIYAAKISPRVVATHSTTDKDGSDDEEESLKKNRHKHKHGHKKERSKKEMILMGGSHGREWIAPASMLYFAHHLLLNSHAPGVKPLLKTLSFTIVPVLNVDGYEFTHTNSRLWRKTRQVVDEESGCFGIDLNRNWGYHWSSEDDQYPCSDDFPGKHAFQAPETKAMSDYVASKDVISFVDLHSYGQLLMYPFSYSCDDFPPDAEDLMEALLGAAKALRSVQGTAYKTGQVCELVYRAAGDSVDWTYGNQEIKWSASMELPDTGTYGFLLPPREIRPVAEETVAALVYLAHFVVQKEGKLKDI
ncbi:peptidase m14 [Phaffia rhodozyma]|uniref:Inactive metallocarboxypeptidase ECM14 n=1 Tax=Phaffia rhodozyma TaxID=264483 RepID=A0A0F7SMP3_PHARH|nr:peptidase m14 [Phaffia rhodozyma]